MLRVAGAWDDTQVLYEVAATGRLFTWPSRLRRFVSNRNSFCALAAKTGSAVRGSLFARVHSNCARSFEVPVAAAEVFAVGLVIPKSLLFLSGPA